MEEVEEVGESMRACVLHALLTCCAMPGAHADRGCGQLQQPCGPEPRVGFAGAAGRHCRRRAPRHDRADHGRRLLRFR
eukprot:2809451-Rhodomonas_salina.5